MSRSSSSRSPLVSIFIGPEGLRAGWRFLLFALAIELVGRLVEFPVTAYLAQKLGVSYDELVLPDEGIVAEIDGRRWHAQP